MGQNEGSSMPDSRVIPFAKCVARPDGAKGTRYLLSAHLLEVARACGSPDGDMDSRLQFLAGLTHDAGKARLRWQMYILNGGPRVNHAPLGSALFTYMAAALLEHWRLPRDQQQAKRLLVLRLARDIYDHHGTLEDRSGEVPWKHSLDVGDFEECDLDGLFAFVGEYFAEAHFTSEGLRLWFDSFPDVWETWQARAEARTCRELNEARNRFSEAAVRCIRTSTARLIAADRYHASGVDAVHLDPESAGDAEGRLVRACRSRITAGAPSSESARLCAQRQWVQDECVEAFVKSPDGLAYTLLLPTGLGKTFSGMRVALRACAMGKCRRIVYVAPYLSILSQATREITAATGLDVLEHHHLSVIGCTARPADAHSCDFKPGSESESEGDEGILFDSWMAPVVTTTFNQLFRALFPTRAQHTMRLRALEGAFIIIDEPQIIDGNVWNLFLAMLEAVARDCDAKVLFSTATLPPLELGMSDPAVALAPEIDPRSRYRIRMLETPLDEAALSELAIEMAKRTGSTAVILNTIRDAAEVYRCIRDSHPGKIACYNLTGCMTAPHKAHRITEIAKGLKAGAPLVVVCTQILECGVDLSFRSILRALPVLPSVVQAAGRANRHAEGAQAEVIVFRFLRRGEVDTRQFVYRALAGREETDACFAEHTEWVEPETQAIVDEYYRRVMARSTATTSLQSLVEAACGSWSSLGRVDPFGPDYPHVDVFVQYGEPFLRDQTKNMLAQFAPGGCEELYEKYLDRRFMSSLSFSERKRFMAVMQHFLVSLDLRTARGLAELPPGVSIARIVDPDLYNEETGLAHLVGMDDDLSLYFV